MQQLIDGRNPLRFEHFKYTNQEMLHPLGVASLVIAIALMFALPRRLMVWPIIILLCFISSAQRFIVGGLDLSFLRVLVVVGVFILMIGGATKKVRVCRLDIAATIFAVLPSLFALVRGNTASVTILMGQYGDFLCSYFLARLAIQNLEDIRHLGRALAACAIPSSMMFLYEQNIGYNLYSIFGGVKEFVWIRNGEPRCQGPFPHAILAGVWWVTSVPLIGMLWWSRNKNSLDGILAVIGVICAVIIVFASNSSTPVSAFWAMLVMVLLYPMRKHFGRLALFTLFTVLALHVVVPSGVHHLIFTRFTVIAGSTGWHRFVLYDEAMKRIGSWGLIGDNSTYNWGWGLDDVTSQYVAASLHGGIIGTVLVIGMYAWGVRVCWKALMRFDQDPMNKAVAYAVGMSLLVLAMCALGTSYFGQIRFLWPFLLGTIPAISLMVPATAKNSVAVKTQAQLMQHASRQQRFRRGLNHGGAAFGRSQ